MEEKSILFEIKTLEQLILREILPKNTNKRLNMKKAPSPTGMRIIDHLINNENKKIYQKDLEQILNLRRATISEVLITLEKNGMIERVTGEHDTRTKEIKLSKQTKKLFNENKEKLLNLENILTKNITKDDLTTFIKVIEKMKENIQNISNT